MNQSCEVNVSIWLDQIPLRLEGPPHTDIVSLHVKNMIVLNPLDPLTTDSGRTMKKTLTLPLKKCKNNANFS